jgi:hypothetical protein
MTTGRPGESGQHEINLGEAGDIGAGEWDGEATEISSVRFLSERALMLIGAETSGSGNTNLGDLDYEDVGDTIPCDPPDDIVGESDTIPVFDLDSDRFDED